MRSSSKDVTKDCPTSNTMVELLNSVSLGSKGVFALIVQHKHPHIKAEIGFVDDVTSEQHCIMVKKYFVIDSDITRSLLHFDRGLALDLMRYSLFAKENRDTVFSSGGTPITVIPIQTLIRKGLSLDTDSVKQ